MGGIEGAVLSAALAGVGTIMQQQATEKAANRQQKIINQAADENLRLQGKKADTITDFAEKTFNPVDREQRYEKAASDNEASLKDSLLSASGGEGQIYEGNEGNLSSDYARTKADATAKATQDILNRTKLLSRSNAAGLMYTDEGTKGATLASDILGINSAAQRNNNAAQAGVGSVRNNGSLLGGLLVAGANAAGNAYDKKYGDKKNGVK